MVSVQHLTALTPGYKNTKQKQKITQNNVVRMNAQNPRLLEDYLSLLGRQNLSLVSFGAKKNINEEPKNFVSHAPMMQHFVTPFDGNFMVEAFRPGISDYAKWKIENEATVRIYGKKPWTKIDNINAWMVSAETNKFMSVGGLAKVAADLPNSFNKKFANDPKNKMTNITPLYTFGDEMKIIEQNGKTYYQYGVKYNEQSRKWVPQTIEITPIGKVNVPIYNPAVNTKLQDTEVQLYKAYTDDSAKEGEPLNHDGTEYIFLHTPAKRIDENGNEADNAQIFSTEDANEGSENNKTPYANNKSGTDEVTRMAFFSKAVYTMMKDAKEGKLKTIQAPNSVLLNDWHAGPLAAMIHYTANAEADNGRISKETGKYFDEVPTIFLAHNLEHQGATNHDDNKRTSIFATLFGEYSADILSNAKSWRADDPKFDPKEEDKIAMMKGTDFNSAVTGIMLSDRIVPVSENYSEELIHSENKARGLLDLLNARAFSPYNRTLTPITNGYSKSLIEPTSEHMTKLVELAKKDFALENKPLLKLDDIKLLPFNNGDLENKVHDKNEVMKIMKRLIERERHLMAVDHDYGPRKYLLHDPFNTELPDTEDFKNIPVAVFVGRFDPQKGLDTILKDAIWKYADENVNTSKEKLPVFIIGGNITQERCFNAIKDMKDRMRDKGGNYAELAKRILLIRGFVNTNLIATAGDMFMIPSVFEPCGLTQMEAMAKGALPIATSTGGLVDTIKDGVDGFRTKAFFDQEGWKTLGRIYGEGFSTNSEAYCEALTRAIDTFHNDRAKFEDMQRNAIKNDFSWRAPNGPLDKYISLIKTGQTT